jgi:small-conductance mechanosensitive channel
VAPLSFAQAELIRQGLVVAFIIVLGWSAMTILHIGVTIYTRRFTQGAADSVAARKMMTQIRILERAGGLLIVIVTAAAALMTFPDVRQYGVSLLASAGAAGLIVGLALQPVLGNLFAGIQLAITQPIRIEDSIVVEGEWGWVEEITSTYVVVRIWDWRRLVLPLKYFIERPFQNWTRDGASIIGNVMLHVDYTAPVPLLRKKAEELVRQSKLWDGQVVNLQVVEAFNDTMQLRLLMSAANAGQAFDLRCEIREKMIAYLQQEYPSALPRRRNETLQIQVPVAAE